ncbi:uncharacterized protein [Rutidosis leptorrhynchoides]|uniref:uncharacterized protein n=1 Tax=Rutidosis leptorrhynchoides TaxID=125765 RepID=UPI003A9A4157
MQIQKALNARRRHQCFGQRSVLKPEKEDTWRWTPGSNGIFTTKVLSDLVDSNILSSNGSNGSNSETLRNNLIPKKVEVFVWRARKLYLPVLVELDKRGIDLHTVRCPLCDDDIETVNHSLILCKHAVEVWVKVFEWWGGGGVAFVNVDDLLQDSGHSTSSVGKDIWQAVIWTCSYLIWKNRNQKVFSNKCWNVPCALNEIQVKSFNGSQKYARKKTSTGIIGFTIRVAFFSAF